MKKNNRRRNRNSLRKKNFNRQKTQKNQIEPQKHLIDDPNGQNQHIECQKLRQLSIAKHLLGDHSNEWKKIRHALPTHYQIPDPDIFKEIKNFFKN